MSHMFEAYESLSSITYRWILSRVKGLKHINHYLLPCVDKFLSYRFGWYQSLSSVIVFFHVSMVSVTIFSHCLLLHTLSRLDGISHYLQSLSSFTCRWILKLNQRSEAYQSLSFLYGWICKS